MTTPATAQPASTTLLRWILYRSGHSAQCVLHALGDRLELHVQMTDDVVLSQQCHGPDEAYAVSSAWWAALVERGWHEQAHVTLIPKSDRRQNTRPIDAGRRSPHATAPRDAAGAAEPVPAM